jgi:hypothetical protein
MNRIIPIILLCCLTISGLMAQDENFPKPQVFTNTYFDISPPLRELVKMAPQRADNSWKDGVVRNIHYPFGFPKNEPSNTPDRTIQHRNGPRHADSVMVDYEGINNVDQVYPPDTDGDVGPNNYFQVVNMHYAVYDKAGNKLLGPSVNSSMFTGLPHNSNDGDPVVLYDEGSDRWVFSQFSLPNYPNGPYYEMVAVSQTNDPTGSWYRYEFTYTDAMPDYPKLAIWPDGIYMTCNRFSGGSSYTGTGASCYDKNAMYAGNSTAQMVYFTLPASNEAYAILPSDCDGTYPPSGTPNFFAWIKPSHIKMYEFHVDFQTPANSTYTLCCTLPVTSYNGSISGIPQKGSSAQLDPIPGRLMFRLPFRTFSDHWAMAACATINVGGNAAIRWWELRNDGSDPTAWSIYQEGTYAPDNNCRWMGSIAMDSLSNIALGYSISSSTMYPSIRYTGRLAGDTLGEMTVAETSIMEGGGAQTYVYGGRDRWGDYSAMNADPSHPGTFWYTQEYLPVTSDMQWHTRIASFSFGNILIVNASANPPLVCIGDSTQLQAMAYGGSGTYTYAWTSNPPGFTSTLQNPWAHPMAPTTYIVPEHDGTLTVTDSIHVDPQAPPAPNAGADTLICNYVPVFTVHGHATGYDQALWSTLGDGYFDNDTALVTQYHPWTQDKANGVYLILTTHARTPCHGLYSDTTHIAFSPCTGIGVTASADLGISIQPNPSDGFFTLKIANLGNQDAALSITDIQGRSVYTHTYQNSGNTLMDHLNLSFLPKGSYFLKVTTETRNHIEKIIIQ